MDREAQIKEIDKLIKEADDSIRAALCFVIGSLVCLIIAGVALIFFT